MSLLAHLETQTCKGESHKVVVATPGKLGDLNYV